MKTLKLILTFITLFISPLLHASAGTIPGSKGAPKSTAEPSFICRLRDSDPMGSCPQKPVAVVCKLRLAEGVAGWAKRTSETFTTWAADCNGAQEACNQAEFTPIPGHTIWPEVLDCKKFETRAQVMQFLMNNNFKERKQS